MAVFDEEAMLRQAEAHARLNSLHSSCSAMWTEIADDYRDRADALMAKRKSSEPAAPVDLNKWPGTAGQPDYSAMKQTVATALHELDRVVAHDYQTPLDPPLKLPAEPAAPVIPTDDLVSLPYRPRPPARPDGIPTRCDWQWMSGAERFITRAMAVVEKSGGSPELTEAVTLLGKARDKVADHMEELRRPAAPVTENNRWPLVEGHSAEARKVYAPTYRAMLLHLDERMTRMTASGFQGPIVIMDGELRFLHGLVRRALDDEALRA